MKGKLIFRVPHLVQWSRLLWCRGRKKLWVQKKGSEGKARLTSCRETDRVRMHWFQLKAIEAVIQKSQSIVNGTKFKYQRAFVFVQMWCHVNVSCSNSFVFINENNRFHQSRMMTTFHHTHGSCSNMFCPPASTTEWSFSRKALSLTSQAWNYNSQQPRPTLSLLYLLLHCREHQNQYSHGLRPVCMLR